VSPSLVTIATKKTHTHTRIYLSSSVHVLPARTSLLWYTPLSTKKERDPTLLSVNSTPLYLSLSLGPNTPPLPRSSFFLLHKLPKCKTLQTHPSPISLSLCRYSSTVLITTNLSQLLALLLLLLTSPLSPGSSSTPSPRLPPPPSYRSRSNSAIKASNEAQKAAHLQGPDVGDDDDHNDSRERRRRRRLPEAPETRTKRSVESSLQAAAATRHKRPAPRPDPPTRAGALPARPPALFLPPMNTYFKTYTPHVCT
jgi:hypothetical protein